MHTLITLFWVAVAIALAMGAGWLFLAAARRLTRGGVARALRGAPVSAGFGMLVILIYVLVALFAHLIAPFGERQVVGAQFLPWDGTYLLGTDNLGRDMLTRLIYGARNTVGIAFATTVLAFSVGAMLGLLAATVGGWLDQVLPGDVYVSVPGGVGEGGQVIEPAIVTALAQAPGVAACTTYRRGVLELESAGGSGEIEFVGMAATRRFRAFPGARRRAR